jgi:hypothetical protein
MKNIEAFEKYFKFDNLKDKIICQLNTVQDDLDLFLATQKYNL